MKYWAFISYSHRDATIADWLHKKLETYRVPASLVGTPSRDGTVPARLLPIFRDREELPTSSQLGDNLQKSLQQSRYLVVICSPAAAQSRWVEEEIRAFKGWQGRDRIIALIGSGIPNASETSDPAAECFPYSLRFEGVGAEATPVRVEPIAADLRPEGDGRQRAFLKIVAGVLGVGFDDLYQREKRREQRRRLLTATAVGVAVLVLGGIYWSFRKELGSVREEAGLMTAQYKDIRPKNKEAEKRILALADQANKALDAFEAATDKPDAEYQAAYQEAGRAVVAVVQGARASDESIFAMEISKPLHERLQKAGKTYYDESMRRAEVKKQEITDKVMREIAEKKREEEARKAAQRPK